METILIQTVRHLSGTVVYKGHTDATGLTAPSYASLRCASQIREAVDVITGEVTLANVEFSFSDEDGHFWRDFLYGDNSEISLELIKDGTTEVLFRGKVTKESVNFEEYDLYLTQRKGSFTCVASIVNLKDVSVQTVITACASDMISLSTWYQGNSEIPWLNYAANTHAKIMNLKRFFERIMEQANGSYDEDDVEVAGFAQDCRWHYDYTTYEWHELYFWCGTWQPLDTTAGWFQAEEWPARFANAFDMFGGLVKSLLAIPVYYYDYTAARHRVRILGRGHGTAGTTPLTMGRIITSSMNPDISRHMKTVAAHSGWSGEATLNRNGYRWLLCEPDTFATEEPVGGVDIDLAMYFLGNLLDQTSDTGDAYDIGGPATIERLYHWPGGTTAYGMQGYHVWDYLTSEYRSRLADASYAYPSAGPYALMGAAMYFRNRFNPKRRSYTRTYEGIGPATGPAGALHLLKNHDITDEDSVTRHFYASEIARDIEKDTVEVKWEEI